jgi:lipopolysaccharide export LptBFGC system permease protein LptF
VLCVGILLSAFTFWINTTVAPRAEQAMRTSIATMARSNPQSLFVADEVVDQFAGKKIFVGDKDGDQMSDITLIEQTPGARPGRIIMARTGEIDVDEDSGELLLTLRDARFEQREDKAEDNLAKIRHGISARPRLPSSWRTWLPGTCVQGLSVPIRCGSFIIICRRRAMMPIRAW